MCSNSVLCSVVFSLLTRSDNIIMHGHVDCLGKIFLGIPVPRISKKKRVNKTPRRDNINKTYG